MNKGTLRKWGRAGIGRRFAVVGLGLMVGLCASAHAAGYLYRYYNAEGHQEIGNSVPADSAASGYEVLDAYSMRVIQVVEAQKSPEEIALLERQNQARAACQTALDRVNRLYQSEADIDAAREHTIRSVQTRIENANVNLAQLQDQKRELEAAAARQERSGQGLDAGLRSNIERANQQIATLEVEIVQRHQEEQDAEAQFLEHRNLFLQGTCEDERAMRFLQAKAPAAASAT